MRNAGAIFLGHHTPEAIGDYVGGPNHVLPTARSARFSSGLGVLDFMKRTTLLRRDAAKASALAQAAISLAEAEGLDAHARSVSARLASARIGPDGQRGRSRPSASPSIASLDEASIGRSSPDQEQERSIAIFDLIERNCFCVPGP